MIWLIFVKLHSHNKQAASYGHGSVNGVKGMGMPTNKTGHSTSQIGVCGIVPCCFSTSLNVGLGLEIFWPMKSVAATYKAKRCIGVICLLVICRI